MSYRYFPINLELYDKKCLVVGGGKVAERKIGHLIECRAKVHVISPEVTANIQKLANDKKIIYEKRNYHSGDIVGFFLVIGATNNEEVNHQITMNCSEQNILVNIVDDPIKCNFIIPAVLRRGSLSISISTDGKSPLMARKIKETLEEQFGFEYEEFLDLLGQVRGYIINNFQDPKERYDKFSELVNSDILDLLRQGKNEIAKERINHVLGNSWSES